MQDLISVAAVPASDQKYIQGITKYFERIEDEAVPELRAFPEVKGGRPTLDWATASDLMLSTLKVKKRLEYGR